MTLPALVKRALLLLLIVLLAGSATAKRLYEYTDENGIRHFTDRPPDTDQPVNERLVRVDDKRMVTLRQGGPPEAREYYFTNHWHGPAGVTVELLEASNVVTDPPLPATFVLPEAGESHLVTVRQDNPYQASRFRLSYSSVPGDPGATPDVRQRYLPPFRRGQRFLIGQGFGGLASHTDVQSYYAVDLGMPEGTPVLAARDGVVMHVEEDFYGAGLNEEKYAARANSVRVLHEDGTMAIYAHLALESVAVKAGRVVTAGELLGLSGNTGYSSGPHLHFAVQHNDGGTLKSLPFRFYTQEREAWVPRAGDWLKH